MHYVMSRDSHVISLYAMLLIFAIFVWSTFAPILNASWLILTDIHVYDVVHGCFRFSHQLWFVIFADLLLPSACLASLILMLRFQHLLQSGMVGRAICIHQPVECFHGFFIVKKQTTLRSKRNKEKYQRVVVVFSLCFFSGSKSLWFASWASSTSSQCT